MRGSDSVSIRENENEACSDWDEYSSFNVEQRYQQLEQVAKQLYDRIKYSAESWNPIAEEIADVYMEHLEALGVSLDD